MGQTLSWSPTHPTWSPTHPTSGPKGFSVRGSGDDLNITTSICCKITEHRRSYGFEKFRYDPHENYILSFKVIPMGDLNAVDIAQQTHLEILIYCTTMSPSEVIAYRSPLPASSCLEGLFFDHITSQVVPNRKLRRASRVITMFRDDEINESSGAKYDKLGIPISRKKKFTKEYSFQACATAVDSLTGRVGTPMMKLREFQRLLTPSSLSASRNSRRTTTEGPGSHRASMHASINICRIIIQEACVFVTKLGFNGPSNIECLSHTFTSKGHRSSSFSEASLAPTRDDTGQRILERHSGNTKPSCKSS